MAPRVLHVSTYDANGGAARAAYALHRAMVDSGIDSRLVVGRKDTFDPTVTAGDRTRFRIASEVDRRISRLERSPLRTWRSAARTTTLTAEQINRSPADIVNLHWVTDGLLSTEEIGRIRKPVVWSMYDMWPFSGTEHYCPDTHHARWRQGYTKANRPVSESGIDVDRWAYERKVRHWGGRSEAFHMIPASTWLAEATRDSRLMGEWPITRIPHVIDAQAFASLDAREARATHGLATGRPTILFLASAGIHDQRKGFDLLEESLSRVAQQIPDVHLLIAGPRDASYRGLVGIDITWLGELRGNDELRAAYCAADVIAAPSREDNMPLTAMEAQMCGRPVVAFRIGGLPDIITHGESGYLADPFDVTDLADGLIAALKAANGGKPWAAAARERAMSLWSPRIVVDSYLEVYSQI